MQTSWIDRLAGPEGRLTRIPWWVWVPAGWVLVSLMESVPRWIDGSMGVGSFDRYALADPFYVVAPLFGYTYLTRVAQASFDRFRPALGQDDPEARRRLSSVTRRMAMIGMLIGGLVGLASYFTDPNYTALVAASPVTAVIFYALGFVGFGMHVVLGTLIVRQLVTVAHLHRMAEHIDLYQPDPVHAFARLTARAGTILLIVALYSALTDPTTFTNPVWQTVFAVAMLLSAAAFFLPLAGLSSRLRVEKQNLRNAAGARISALTDEMRTTIDGRRLSDVAELRTAITAVVEEQDRIKKMSAWPWETATIRGFATTLLLPITIWFITSLLSETLGL